jgi:hypothetical protein
VPSIPEPAPGPALASNGSSPRDTPDAEPPDEILIRERTVDAEGFMRIRLQDRSGRVLRERLIGHVSQLEVRSVQRTVDGEIAEALLDADGPIEVRRDPVGRFLWAAARSPQAP